MSAEPTQRDTAVTLSEQVRLELTRLLAELNPMAPAPSSTPATPAAVSDGGTFAAEVLPRVTQADIALALGRPVRSFGFGAVGMAASVLSIGAWLVSAWGPMTSLPPEGMAVRAATRVSTDPDRMTQVQSATDVVHLWAQSGAGTARVIRGQMWWSPSTGVALWARVEPLSKDDGLGYQAWFVSDRGTHYLGPIRADQAGTISLSFDPPPHATGRPVRVLVTVQPPSRTTHPADRVVLEAKF
jgi:hypothetical protein